MNKKPFFINLISILLVTVLIWIGYSIYSALSKPAQINVPKEALEDFDATLDDEALIRLQESVYLNEEELVDSVTVVSTPQPENIEVEEGETELINEEPADENLQP